ncbi:hypothetical protein E2C01_094116 [Portunus trituberculatus]|uniref:Uncharacterized protein n=1 Tax=Portunus trituberculatus TaxID=210409 RepID=A0A5B7JW30_PORTR|nr:hypothetical protein [Portunus trituberculatus]
MTVQHLLLPDSLSLSTNQPTPMPSSSPLQPTSTSSTTTPNHHHHHHHHHHRCHLQILERCLSLTCFKSTCTHYLTRPYLSIPGHHQTYLPTLHT